MSSGRWSEVESRWVATIALAPDNAKELEARVRSRILPLLWVGLSISEIRVISVRSSYLLNKRFSKGGRAYM